MGQRRYAKKITDKAIGFCTLDGSTLKGLGIDAGPGDDFGTVCPECAAEITSLMLERFQAKPKTDLVKFFAEHPFLDERGRLREESLAHA